jgi:hypothetical protein
MRNSKRTFKSTLGATMIASFTPLLPCPAAYATPETWQCEFPGEGPITYVGDVATGKGKANGTMGTVAVSVHQGPAAISFIEPTPTGTVHLTTIVLRTGEASRSRNTVTSLMDGTFLASQVIGKCRPIP